MLQIVINVEKKHLYAFVLLIGLVGSFVYAYTADGAGTGDPAVMGHSFDEVAAGQARLGDVSSSEKGLRVYGNPSPGFALVRIEDSTPSDGNGDALDVIGDLFVDGYLYNKFIDSGTLTCDGDTWGAIVYDSIENEPCFCNGVGWMKFSGGAC